MNAIPANADAAGQEGLYVYCVARGDGNHLFGPIGLDGRMVYTAGTGAVRAVVHNCRPEPYQSQDPEVVHGRAVAHQGVVLAASRAFGTVLPMSFDMIVRGDPGGGAAAALGAWLDEKRGRFNRLMDRLAGKAEYGVQVLWDREAVAASLLQGDDALRTMQQEALGKPRGLAHVLQHKLAKAVRVAMEAQADVLAQDSYARIRRCAEDVRIEKLRRLDGSEQMFLNLSCLLAEGDGELGRVLDEIQTTAGVSVRFTGPWPPYSFVGT